jgi:hypothetical protein
MSLHNMAKRWNRSRKKRSRYGWMFGYVRLTSGGWTWTTRMWAPLALGSRPQVMPLGIESHRLGRQRRDNRQGGQQETGAIAFHRHFLVHRWGLLTLEEKTQQTQGTNPFLIWSAPEERL